jgi:hypothetical protein
MAASDPLRLRLPLIAILRGIRPREACDHIGVLVEEGFDAIEIPLNSPGWRESIGAALRGFGDAATIGGGTVLQEADIEAADDDVPEAPMAHPIPLQPEIALLSPARTRSISPENPTGAAGAGGGATEGTGAAGFYFDYY